MSQILEHTKCYRKIISRVSFLKDANNGLLAHVKFNTEKHLRLYECKIKMRMNAMKEHSLSLCPLSGLAEWDIFYKLLINQ